MSICTGPGFSSHCTWPGRSVFVHAWIGDGCWRCWWYCLAHSSSAGGHIFLFLPFHNLFRKEWGMRKKTLSLYHRHHPFLFPNSPWCPQPGPQISPTSFLRDLIPKPPLMALWPFFTVPCLPACQVCPFPAPQNHSNPTRITGAFPGTQFSTHCQKVDVDTIAGGCWPTFLLHGRNGHNVGPRQLSGFTARRTPAQDFTSMLWDISRGTSLPPTQPGPPLSHRPHGGVFCMSTESSPFRSL